MTKLFELFKDEDDDNSFEKLSSPISESMGDLSIQKFQENHCKLDVIQIKIKQISLNA